MGADARRNRGVSGNEGCIRQAALAGVVVTRALGGSEGVGHRAVTMGRQGGAVTRVLGTEVGTRPMGVSSDEGVGQAGGPAASLTVA